MYVWAKKWWIHPEKIRWQWKTKHEWRCISYWKWGFPIVIWVFGRVFRNFGSWIWWNNLKPSKTYVKTGPPSPRALQIIMASPGCITQWQPGYDRNPRTVWNSSCGMAKNLFMAQMVASKEKSWILMRMKRSWKSNKWRNPILEPFNWDLENLIR